MKPKSDDQRDNAKEIQNNQMTQNMEATNELIGKTDDQRKQEENERRRAALENMRKEMHEEAEHPRKTFP